MAFVMLAKLPFRKSLRIEASTSSEYFSNAVEGNYEMADSRKRETYQSIPLLARRVRVT